MMTDIMDKATRGISKFSSGHDWFDKERDEKCRALVEAAKKGCKISARALRVEYGIKELICDGKKII